MDKIDHFMPISMKPSQNLTRKILKSHSPLQVVRVMTSLHPLVKGQMMGSGSVIFQRKKY